NPEQILTFRVPEGRHAVLDGIFIGLHHAQNHAARSITMHLRTKKQREYNNEREFDVRKRQKRTGKEIRYSYLYILKIK
ncbi:MAG: hypothetical protein LBP50_04485, partial [Tannerella sp.]|nr:hypothetical protein [Tannerella sp.]